ncbi:methylated-DNA--[protein]-cysteine S-methyltransferase [Zhihengliuella flava]|uniref:Methylated-DNA--protein-cysteine methyltransferase n=1 Tax=Zhihengliuella flava TaxID=1285193 RepID=A0A931GM10_9MICC|nr:methylated-DNA--[protein]-cysteine S-methyltransferase [Zhihengliuella flava]MBG6084964.1 methylated-DNA-[protein]-cysteine S-methyltransferase [Zhihengliuella flava]
MTPGMHDRADTTVGDAAAEEDARHVAALRRQLVGAAEAAGIVDVAYRVVDSPVGPLLVAATEDGLVRVAFSSEGHESVLEHLSQSISPRVLQAPGRLDDAARQLEAYFTGRSQTFDLRVDLRRSTPFRRRVQEYLPLIEFGQTASYRQVAEQVGSPRAVRAVGTACATNPLPIVIPCHRVLRSDGGLGGYLGGTDAKAELLALEGHPPAGSGQGLLL